MPPRSPRRPAPRHVHALERGTSKLLVTTCPPLPVEWGRAWWVRLDDGWLELRPRRMGETMTPELAEELRELVAARAGNR